VKEAVSVQNGRISARYVRQHSGRAVAGRLDEFMEAFGGNSQRVLQLADVSGVQAAAKDDAITGSLTGRCGDGLWLGVGALRSGEQSVFKASGSR